MQESTEGLLMEGMRQLDEYRVQLEKLPPLSRRRSPSRARSSRSCATSSPEELDVFQAALEVKTVGGAVRPVAADRPRHRREAGPPVRKRLPRRRLYRVSMAGQWLRSLHGSCRSGASPLTLSSGKL